MALGTGCGRPPKPGRTFTALFGEVALTLDMAGWSRGCGLTVPDTQSDDQWLVADSESNLGSRECVARWQINAATLSLASEFAVLAASDTAIRIAATGLVTVENRLSPRRQPVPVLDVHGTANPIVPYSPTPLRPQSAR